MRHKNIADICLDTDGFCHFKRIALSAILAASALVGLTNCDKKEFSKNAPPPSQAVIWQNPGNGPVCDPFAGGGNPISATNGIIADLYAVDGVNCDIGGTHNNYNPACGVVSYYISDANKSGANIFLSNIFYPTQHFNQGFWVGKNKSQEITRNGQSLTEWFALRMNSTIKLAPGDAPGDYQFAVLADDGAVVTIDGATTIDNEGIRPGVVRCSDQSFNFQPGVSKSLNLNYFQGPRDHIALVLLWRHASGSAASDPDCNQPGTADNAKYFDPDNGSSEQPAYTTMKINGWTELKPENFVLPGGATNPCF